jgi:aspartate/methionine/tyrosine aminotransferase
MLKTPIPSDIVDAKIAESNITDIGSASIRELVHLVNEIETASGERFIRMEMGIPGLPPPRVGIDAEIKALENGVASKYPMIDGVPELKSEASRFIKLFMDLEIPARSCVPTVGAMQGSYAAFLVSAKKESSKDTILFIDPGFPVQKQQLQVMGVKFRSFDVYNHRGLKLRAKLAEELAPGDVAAIVYSNPNNPSWICLNDEELRIIGEMSEKHDVTAIEDLAYFAMDFRRDLSKPGEPPYQPTVAKHTDNHILLISSSKIFSYAGQRVAVMAVSPKLFDREFSGLREISQSTLFGHALVYGALYALSSGVAHSAQFALAAMFKAANDGEYDFVKTVSQYGERASEMKRIFLENGFEIVYDTDLDVPLADGFYFTFSYPGMTGGELLAELLYYGVSAIGLSITGSDRTEGLRACVSLARPERFPELRERLRRFKENH